MQNKLQYLFTLQTIDTRLKEIEELKGDLPVLVNDLEKKFNEQQQKIKELNLTLKQSKINRDNADVELIDLAEKIEKYKSQQLHVKSNKQYDALTKEIEMAEEKSTKLEKEMELFEGKIKITKTDIENLTAQLEEMSTELEDRKGELQEVNREHEKEELKLHHEREKLSVRLDKAGLERYERIRKAKGGQAVVPIKRDSCGGCYNRIPPQKILEIRQNSNLYSCEHCGRILVSDHITETSSVI
ncbi:MAG TPA: C4-type zinc ribbon domain-containing protein [Bacteroidota bacterium]|nr:C4-type zinc ribbon domain-containing protein [Bacteroidota bacterium]